MGGEEERVMEGNVIKIYTRIKSSKINKNIKKKVIYIGKLKETNLYFLSCVEFRFGAFGNLRVEEHQLWRQGIREGDGGSMQKDTLCISVKMS